MNDLSFRTAFVPLSLALAACSAGNAPAEGAAGPDLPAGPRVPSLEPGSSTTAPPPLADAGSSQEAGPRDAASPGPEAAAPRSPRERVLALFSGISGTKTLAAQHNKFNGTPSSASDWVAARTGKRAAFWSADFGFGSDQVDQRARMVAEAKRQWADGAVVQIMYHACSPTRDEYCSWDDVGGARPAHLSDAQWSELVTEGTALNRAWKTRLDTLAVFLGDLQASGVAPLFRPLHEMNQGVFWWGGRKGANGTRRLWRITYDYLVRTKGLTGLVWVWDIQDFASLRTDVVDYDPGSDTYDIAALDVYDGGYAAWKYDAMRSIPGGKPIAIGECQQVPTPAESPRSPRGRSSCGPDFLDANAQALQTAYRDPRVVTLAQMPGWR